MNEHEKLIINQLRIRMETNPDEPLLFKGNTYTPAEMIKEIKRQTEQGKALVKEIVDEVWADKLRNLRISGWTGGTNNT